MAMNLQKTPQSSIDGIIASMIDLKNADMLWADTGCTCESVETQTIETRDDEGNCTCNTETRTISREYYCNCDDN